jgi:hypothetical protein
MFQQAIPACGTPSSSLDSGDTDLDSWFIPHDKNNIWEGTAECFVVSGEQYRCVKAKMLMPSM